ncbi:UPF0481 protein At3g47200-like [Momordica charantia]|uniref:UPF0481 protein At3g47200-like n=1 Tax=Momordica charantia TaxID=3673 RepID=A0A6J1BVD4_MOMCH|nr:UPF0481 protein At3g47200-like [Momordica charantia]
MECFALAANKGDALRHQQDYCKAFYETPWPTKYSVDLVADQQSEEDDLSLELSIIKLLEEQPPIAAAEWCIYRVPKRLFDMKSTAYTPKVIAIGPFHHGRNDLLATQQSKLHCFRNYLIRIERDVKYVVAIARQWEIKARRLYAEPINMTSDDFVRMMLIDACFIVELMIILNFECFETREGFDLLFAKVILHDLYQELTMLENQLPFFVLQALFDLFPPHKNKANISFIQLTGKFLSNGLIRGYNLPCGVSSTEEVNHLVDLLGFYYVPSPDTEEYRQNKEIKNRIFLLPPTITKLCEAGVKVKKAIGARSLLDISFKRGVLQIPPFEIHDDFEIYVRNLMAFEQYCVREPDDDRYVIHYIEFLDGLISTAEDVALLVKEGIIINHIGGSNKEVSELFNNLCKNTPIPFQFYFYATSKNLHDHCRKWWPRSKATLRRDYFHSPWAYISVFAATFLILLALLQTIFTAKSTFN